MQRLDFSSRHFSGVLTARDAHTLSVRQRIGNDRIGSISSSVAQ